MTDKFKFNFFDILDAYPGLLEMTDEEVLEAMGPSRYPVGLYVRKLSKIIDKKIMEQVIKFSNE